VSGHIFVCYRGIDFASFYHFVLMDLGTVPTGWYFGERGVGVGVAVLSKEGEQSCTRGIKFASFYDFSM
jgi:hypothetical protein